MRRRPKKAVFSFTGRLGPYGKPLTGRDGPYGKGPLYGEGRSLREGPVFKGSALQGWLPLQKRTAYVKLLGEILPELGGNFRLCAVDQKRSFFLRAGPFLAFLPFKEAYEKAGPLWEAPYGEGRSLREGPVLTGSPLQGWLPLQKKLRREILPELGGNFRLCAVDQKRPFFPRAGPFLAFLPFKEAYGKAGPYGKPLTGRDGPYGNYGDLSPQQGPLRADRLTGRPLTGRLLTGRPLMGRFFADTFNYRKAYGKAGPLREAIPYGKPLTGRDGFYGKGRCLREAP